MFPGLLAGGIRGGNQSALLQRRAETIQKQIRNCTDAIAEGKRYPSLMEKLAELEHDLAEAESKDRAFRTSCRQAADVRRASVCGGSIEESSLCVSG
jgi:hypothetical protein